MEKSELRERYCDIRECLSEQEVVAASRALCRRLADMAILQEADTIMAYLAFRNEPDLRTLFDLLPEKEWVLPRIEGKEMTIHPYDSEKLIRHRYGMLEPPADEPVVDAPDLDVVLVPGVSFDRRGGRIGFGGGFYDRFLIKTSAVRIGICYDACLSRELPCAEHDQRMDWVLTPAQAIHAAPLWRRECSIDPEAVASR